MGGILNLKNEWMGFPGGAVVESLPASAGDTGSCPGLGGSHMPRSGWAREPQLLSLRVWSLCSATREAATVRGPRTAMKSGPRLPQLEKALAQKRSPNIAINQSINQKKKKVLYREFPGGPMVRTLSSHFRGSIPSLGTKIPHTARRRQNK